MRARMSNSSFSRRDILRLGGKLVLTVGAAKIVVALPGCDNSTTPLPDAARPDAMPDAYDHYAGYATLDDCHSIGTYDYRISHPTYAYTYHYYFTGAYGCPYYVYPLPANLKCYPDYPDFAPNYPYFCFTGYYLSTSMP